MYPFVDWRVGGAQVLLEGGAYGVHQSSRSDDQHQSVFSDRILQVV